MRLSSLVLTVYGLSSLGCHAPVATPTNLAIVNTPPPPLIVGGEYAIEVKTNSADRRLTYEGQVKEIDGHTIILDKPTRTSIRDDTPPVLGHLPGLGRYFKSVGIGQTKSDQDVTLDRRDILDATPIENAKSVDEPTAPPAGERGPTARPIDRSAPDQLSR